MSRACKKSFLVLCVFMLSSCAGALVAGAAAGGAIMNDSRSFTEMDTDARISHDLGVLLTRNKKLKTSHIVVSSYKRMVFLGGEVPAPELRAIAQKTALKVPHVVRVYNEIVIGPNTTLKQQAIDAWISANIKTRMLAREGLRSGTIKVITEQGVVFLMGSITQDQANLAVDVARRVEGVKRVVKIFNYKQ